MCAYGNRAQRHRVSDSSGFFQSLLQGQKCKAVSSLEKEVGYYGSDMCRRREANSRRHFIAVSVNDTGRAL